MLPYWDQLVYREQPVHSDPVSHRDLLAFRELPERSDLLEHLECLDSQVLSGSKERSGQPVLSVYWVLPDSHCFQPQESLPLHSLLDLPEPHFRSVHLLQQPVHWYWFLEDSQGDCTSRPDRRSRSESRRGYRGILQHLACRACSPPLRLLLLNRLP
jgi:hypothetical protein